jgi:leucyl aminopeptidase
MNTSLNLSPGPAVRCVASAPREVDTELLVVPVFKNDTSDLGIDGLDEATGGEVNRARTSREFSAKPNEVFLARIVDGNWRAARIALIGVGNQEVDGSARFRKAASVASLKARRHRVDRMAFIVRGGIDMARDAQAVAEGLVLGNFEDRRYKTTADNDLPVSLVDAQVVLGSVTRELERAVEKGKVLAESVNLARSLSNEPGNMLTPTTFSSRAVELVGSLGLKTEILDETAIAELGMGLLLGVGRGSAEPSRLIVIRYEPKDVPDGPILGLVGKGVTFDSGGISIKPAGGMERMKEDMSGGAAVICAMRAIGSLGPARRVIGIVPATENMPGGRATKPGDVLRSASGATVEVANTDAEGRLILGDALWYARHLGATHLVDVATLTGSCIVALGNTCSGLFGRPDSWTEAVRLASEQAGERVWPLPLFQEYTDQMRSEIADLVNSGGREAGACTAAAFLQEFAGELPWAHLDIAGTAWCEDGSADQAKGATGVMVRTLVELACGSTNW